MSLYFNAIFLPIWTATMSNFVYNHYTADHVTKVLITALFVTIFTLEVTRLILGYYGNLGDEIAPQLAAFWLLSLMLQTPLQTFVLVNPRLGLCIHEVVLQTVMGILLLVQLLTGYTALKYTAKQQAIKYKITKLSRYDLDTQSLSTQ